MGVEGPGRHTPPPPPPQRSPAPALLRGERWGRSAPCGGALRRFPALVAWCSPRGLLTCSTPLRCAAAGGGGMHGRADKSVRLSWWSQALGATRGAGERSLSQQTKGREKVAVRARRTLAGVHGSRVVARRCQRGQLEARKVTELRLVTPRHPRVHANLHYFDWNVLPVCGGATACGRCPRCFTSGGHNSPPGSTAGCERRMDLFILQGAYRLLVDGTRIDGATDSYLRRALAVSQPLHGVEEAEKEKHKRYPDRPAPMEFKPVTVGTQIELGASAREVIGMLAKRAAARTCAGLTPTSAAVARETRITMGELGIGVMRAQATQILDGTPHAAIAKILGRGAMRRNLGRHVPAKLCVCSAMTCVCGSGRKPWEEPRQAPPGLIPTRPTTPIPPRIARPPPPPEAAGQLPTDEEVQGAMLT